MGDNYREVDLTANALINVGAIHESSESNISTNSVNSNSTTLYEFQSDEIGNIINIGGIEFNWNGRRLESIGIEGIEYLTYDYNIDGQRVKKNITDPETGTIITTEYFYNGDILAGQKTGNDTIIFMYDNNGDIFGFEYNGTPYYYLKNAQNDVVMVFNSYDRTAVVYQYDAWGNITDVYDSTTQRVSNINPITYRSYYYDIEMGVYYLNSRYYAPVICRFISGDNVTDGGAGELGYNLFVYAANNPVNNSDPSGHGIVSAILCKVAVGAVLGAVANTASQLINNGWNWKNLDYKQIGASALAGGVSGLISGGVGEVLKKIGAKVFVKCVASVIASGVSSTVGYAVETTINEKKVTASESIKHFALGATVATVAICGSVIKNGVSFSGYTKSDKRIALGGNVTNRNIRNGFYKTTEAYKEFLINGAEHLENALGTTVSIFFD